MNFKIPNVTMQTLLCSHKKCSQKVVSTPQRAPRHTWRLSHLASKNIAYENDGNNKILKKTCVTPLVRMIWIQLDSNNIQIIQNNNQ